MNQELNIIELLEDEKTPADKIKRHLELLALARTAFSSERSLLAWMRTSVSLFTFGFAIFQFFQFLGQPQGGEGLAAGPRRLAIVLICVGVLVLGSAMIEHVYRLRALQQHGLPNFKQYLLPLGSATVLLVIGFSALLGVIFNLTL